MKQEEEYKGYVCIGFEEPLTWIFERQFMVHGNLEVGILYDTYFEEEDFLVYIDHGNKTIERKTGTHVF